LLACALYAQDDNVITAVVARNSRRLNLTLVTDFFKPSLSITSAPNNIGNLNNLIRRKFQ